MAYALDEFAADCRRILKADPGPAGRDTVRKKLRDLLMTSIAYPAGARFIRVTGTNLETIARGRYNSEAGTMW